MIKVENIKDFENWQKCTGLEKYNLIEKIELEKEGIRKSFNICFCIFLVFWISMLFYLFADDKTKFIYIFTHFISEIDEVLLIVGFCFIGTLPIIFYVLHYGIELIKNKRKLKKVKNDEIEKIEVEIYEFKQQEEMIIYFPRRFEIELITYIKVKTGNEICDKWLRVQKGVKVSCINKNEDRDVVKWEKDEYGLLNKLEIEEYKNYGRIKLIKIIGVSEFIQESQ